MTAPPSSPDAEYRACRVPGSTGCRRHLPGRPNGRPGWRFAASAAVIVAVGTACTCHVHRRRLASASVATRRLGCVERRQQTFGQLALRRGKRRSHIVNHGVAR